MQLSRLFILAAAAALVLAGVFVSASTIMDVSGRGAPLPESLHQGAILFKLGLIVLGLSIAILSALRLDTPRTTRRRHEMEAAPAYSWLILATILIASAALCVHRLNDGLWLDEILTLVNYVRHPLGQIVTTYDDPNQHMLYSLLAHGSFAMLGESNFALRLPAMLFGIGSVWALFMVGRLVTSNREALLSSALLAFSYQLIWFSQNARGYTGLLFLTLLASWFFLRGLREARPHLWVGYAITIALGIYIHLTMLFVVVGHFVQYAIACFSSRDRDLAWPQRWTVMVYGFGLGAVLTFLSYSLVLPQVFAAFTTVKKVPGLWMRPSWSLLEFARGLQLSLSGAGMAVAGLVVFGAGLLSFRSTDIDLVELFAFPSMLCIAVMVAKGQHLWPRTIFFTMGFMVLIVTRGTSVLGARIAQVMRIQGRELAIGTAIWLALILASARSIPRAYGPKQDYAGAWAFVEAHKQPSDAVVTVGLAAIPYRILYHADAQEVRSVASLDAVRARSSQTWLLYTLKTQLANLPRELQRAIDQDFVVERKFPGTLGGGTIFVCRSSRPSGS